MKQIIEEVLKAEQKISTDLKEARRKASEILRSVETENLKKVNDASRKARDIIQTSIEGAKRQTELIRKESLGQAQRDKEDLLKSNTNAIDTLVDEICKIILNTEHNRDGE